jgi:putative aldouronate transport system permease protein
MLIPGLIVIIIINYLPYFGILIAFKDYNIFAGNNPIDAIIKSDWVGLTNFNKLFTNSYFWTVFKNTIIINGLKVIWLFPLPIICAVMLNEIKNSTYRRVTQTVIYMPYFFSWVVIFSIFSSILSTHGIVNMVITSMGFDRISFFMDVNIFRGLLVFTDGWKTVGYNTVIFLAAISAIDSTLYEAAKIDGASKIRQIWNITIPGILPTIILMLILRVGHILDSSFEQVLVFYNPIVYDVADIIQTYVYRMGIGQMNFSLSTALGLFNSVVAFILIVGANTASRKLLNRSIW